MCDNTEEQGITSILKKEVHVSEGLSDLGKMVGIEELTLGREKPFLVAERNMKVKRKGVKEKRNTDEEAEGMWGCLGHGELSLPRKERRDRLLPNHGGRFVSCRQPQRCGEGGTEQPGDQCGARDGNKGWKLWTSAENSVYGASPTAIPYFWW